jgi:molybdenum cofactor guanylyltransferase
VCADVCILSGEEPRWADRGVPVVVDAVAGAGPLGALHAALTRVAPEDAALLLGVDLPLVPSELLAWLVDESTQDDALVPVTSSGPEPLCAVYRGRCLPAVARRLELGDRRMTSFWPDVRVRQVGEGELARFGDPARLFRNLNTPEDYEAARRNP